MGKFTSKLLNSLGINTTEEDDFEEYEEVSAPTMMEEPASFKRGKVVNINATTQFRVVVIQPETFDEAKEIADHLKERKPVVINLELMEKEQAKKIFDFLNGAIYALGGSIQQIATSIYLFAPYNVTIMSDFRDELKSKGFLWNS